MSQIHQFGLFLCKVHPKDMKAYYADINTEVVSRLRALRKSKRLSQKYLAELLGETQASVSRV